MKMYINFCKHDKELDIYHTEKKPIKLFWEKKPPETKNKYATFEYVIIF